MNTYNHKVLTEAIMLLQGLIDIANEPDDEVTPMSREVAHQWAHEQLIADFGVAERGTMVVAEDGAWQLEYQLSGQLAYVEPTLRFNGLLRPVIARLVHGEAQEWCVYWVDEIGINDLIEWFPTHHLAAQYLGRLVVAAFTAEHIDEVTL